MHPRRHAILCVKTRDARHSDMSECTSVSDLWIADKTNINQNESMICVCHRKRETYRKSTSTKTPTPTPSTLPLESNERPRCPCCGATSSAYHQNAPLTYPIYPSIPARTPPLPPATTTRTHVLLSGLACHRLSPGRGTERSAGNRKRRRGFQLMVARSKQRSSTSGTTKTSTRGNVSTDTMGTERPPWDVRVHSLSRFLPLRTCLHSSMDPCFCPSPWSPETNGIVLLCVRVCMYVCVCV